MTKNQFIGDKILSFHNDPKIKEFYLNRIKQNDCTIHSSEFSKIGIPIVLIKLMNVIFESYLPHELAKYLFFSFIKSIPIGKDLSKIWPQFAIFLLTHKSQYNNAHPFCKIVADTFQNELHGIHQNWDELKVIFSNYIESDLDIEKENSIYIATQTGAKAIGYAAYTAATAIYIDAAEYATIIAIHTFPNAFMAQSEKLLDLLKNCS